MPKTPVAVLLTALLTTTVLAAGATSASAANAPCVTRAEFKHVSKGMSPARVAQVFGTEGTLVFRMVTPARTQILRQYVPCPRASYVSVSFVDSHETTKSAIWAP